MPRWTLHAAVVVAASLSCGLASAQEIQLTGPLAGAPSPEVYAVSYPARLRMHRVARAAFTSWWWLASEPSRFDGGSAHFWVTEKLSLGGELARRSEAPRRWQGGLDAQVVFMEGKHQLFGHMIFRSSGYLQLGAALLEDGLDKKMVPNLGGGYMSRICQWLAVEVTGGVLPFRALGQLSAHPRVGLSLIFFSLPGERESDD